MDYSVALDRIKQSLGDNAADVLAAIADRVSALEQDASLWKRRHTSLESQLTALKEVTEGKDVKEYISALKDEAEKANSKITELEKEKTEAIAKVEQYERETLYRTAATKAGVNQDALLNLVKAGLLPDLKLEGEAVTVGGKKMDEYLGEPGREWIKNALQVTTDSSPNTKSEDDKPSVPTGGTNAGSSAGAENPVESVFKSIGVFIPGVK